MAETSVPMSSAMAAATAAIIAGVTAPGAGMAAGAAGIWGTVLGAEVRAHTQLISV